MEPKLKTKEKSKYKLHFFYLNLFDIGTAIMPETLKIEN